MNSFKPFLRRINEKLDLPQSTKSTIILEITADLNDLFEHYISEGFSEKEARQMAQEKMDISEEALLQLIELHQSGLKKLLQRLSLKSLARWEKGVLTIILLIVLAFFIPVMSSSTFFLQSSLFVWPILFFSFIALAISLRKVYELYVKQVHATKKLRNGMTLLWMLSGLSLFTGIFGYFFEIYQSGGYTILPAVNLFFHLFSFSDINHPHPNIIDMFLRSCSVGMVSLLMTVFIALLWFGLMTKIEKIERAEFEFLLAE
jgi:hypothetical protein